LIEIEQIDDGRLGRRRGLRAEPQRDDERDEREHGYLGWAARSPAWNGSGFDDAS